MSIHSEHPFLEPPSERNPLRRLRGRLPAPVTVWTTGADPRGQSHGRTGLTVSSVLIADGDPGEVLGLVDGDSDFADRLQPGGTVALSLLGQGDQAVADVFAGLAPSPGGMFRTGDWTDTDWGPVLIGAPWVGIRLDRDESGRAGWALLVRGRIEEVNLESCQAAVEPLTYLRGRYRRLADEGSAPGKVRT